MDLLEASDLAQPIQLIATLMDPGGEGALRMVCLEKAKQPVSGLEVLVLSIEVIGFDREAGALPQRVIVESALWKAASDRLVSRDGRTKVVESWMVTWGSQPTLPGQRLGKQGIRWLIGAESGRCATEKHEEQCCRDRPPTTASMVRRGHSLHDDTCRSSYRPQPSGTPDPSSGVQIHLFEII
jgi:hypothetical protein